MLTIEEIALKFNKNKTSIYNQIYKHKIIRDKCLHGINYYGKAKEQLIGSFLDDIKYYPLKTTETFYIYESKMNYDTEK